MFITLESFCNHAHVPWPEAIRYRNVSLHLNSSMNTDEVETRCRLQLGFSNCGPQNDRRARWYYESISPTVTWMARVLLGCWPVKHLATEYPQANNRRIAVSMQGPLLQPSVGCVTTIDTMFSVWSVRRPYNDSYRHNRIQFLSDSHRVQLSSRVTEQEMARRLHSDLKW
jgi:hypothetical protein